MAYSDSTGTATETSNPGAATPASERLDFVNRANADYIERLYEQYQRDPRSLDEFWQAYFAGFETAGGRGFAAASGTARVTRYDVVGALDRAGWTFGLGLHPAFSALCETKAVANIFLGLTLLSLLLFLARRPCLDFIRMHRGVVFCPLCGIGQNIIGV